MRLHTHFKELSIPGPRFGAHTDTCSSLEQSSIPDGVPILRASDELPSTTRELAVRGGLDTVQLRVLTFLGHQLLVRADLH
jgi:hypothetical protein